MWGLGQGRSLVSKECEVELIGELLESSEQQESGRVGE